jgi:branched-chain amino acid transport system substrate-binding protein
MRVRSVLLAATALAALSGAADAQISGDVVKIGILNDQGGPYADVGGRGSVAAARIAAAELGDKVNGKTIEIISADHQNKPDVAGAIARRWIENEGVDVIVDGAASSAGLAINEVTRDKTVFLVTGPASSDFTGKFCSPTSFHFVYDTYALANGTGKALVEQGGDTWFFLTADYAFGHALERDTTQFVRAGGGKVLGGVKHPLNTSDFSSFLVQAQSSKAKIVGLANAGTDTINAIKQAAEFGIVKGGQRLAGLLVFISDVHALGLQTAQGLVVTNSFYWDQNEQTRAWTEKFLAQSDGKVPTMIHAGVYSSVKHYLKAIQAAGSDDSKTVAMKMRQTPVDDMYNKGVKIREDGRVLHDMYLVEVKKPEESKGKFDYYKVLATIPGEKAFRPLSESECPLVKKG